MPVGAIVSEAWTLYRGHWRHLVGVAAVVYVAVAALTLLLVLAFDDLGLFVSGMLALAGIFWVQGALVVAVQDIRDGRADLSVRQTIEAMQPRLNALAGVALLVLVGMFVAAFAIGIGLLLLILPGLALTVLFCWLLVRWILVVPVLMLEGRSVFDSFGRSAKLVRGSGWSVFGVVALTVVVLVAVGIVVGLALVWLPEHTRGPVTQLVSSSLTAPFAALAWTLTYFRLRAREESSAPAAAEVPV
jgi:hypothetical protein